MRLELIPVVLMGSVLILVQHWSRGHVEECERAGIDFLSSLFDTVVFSSK